MFRHRLISPVFRGKWASKRGGAKAADERWAKLLVTLEDIGPDSVKALAANKTEKFNREQNTTIGTNSR